MNIRLKILFLLVLATVTIASIAQSKPEKQDGLYLFTDKDYCISGDTLWIKVNISKAWAERSNVIHVQLDSRNGNLINAVTLKRKNGWAEGFIHVPDSLSTGIYFVSSFLNSQRSSSELVVPAKTLFVYNRFDENISEFPVPGDNLIQKIENETTVQILTDREEYATRQTVNGEISFQSDNVRNALVSARLVDPLSSGTAGRINFKASGSYPEIPHFDEIDGILLSGHVFDADKKPKANELVLLSITEEPPYFDYCITGEKGDYHFFLKDATGTASLVLQTVSKNFSENQIQPCTNHLKRIAEVPVNSVLLTPVQTEFISELIKGNFIDKLFNPTQLASRTFFEMPHRYNIPFYGPPTKRIVPSEFIDLPDFKEISRELLPGVQYRTRGDEVTFRMINLSQKVILDNEPLRLLNGIPIFKNNLLTSLQSTDIDYIDLVQTERVYGDLVFKGIMAVSLNNKSNSWMSQQSNIFQFNIPCLQPENKPGYNKAQNLSNSEPDVRQVYLWKTLDVQDKNEINFDLSDFKGQVEIVVEGITVDNRMFQTSRIIEVK